LTVASGRQIEANRRNAGKSTGPRSESGKKRSGHNAYRHGCSLGLPSSSAIEKEIDKLSHKIAGHAKSEAVLRWARDAAEAEFELERIRKIKVALIERASALGAIEPAMPFSATKSLRRPKLVIAGKATLEERIDHRATLPPKEPQRAAEALRRALPDLLRLDRYERRATGRRDQAIKHVSKNKIRSLIETGFLAERSQFSSKISMALAILISGFAEARPMGLPIWRLINLTLTEYERVALSSLGSKFQLHA
jgi:hypothetical protein